MHSGKPLPLPFADYKYIQMITMLRTVVYSERLVLPLWRSLHSLNLMLPKEDRKAMLLRLYNDDTPLKDSSKERFNSKPPASGDRDEKDVKEEEADAETEVKQEMDVMIGEGEEGVGAVEEGEGEGKREDDVVPDAVKEAYEKDEG